MLNIKEIFESLINRNVIIQIIHDSKNVLLIWWYAPKENKLEYFEDAEGHNDRRFEVVKTDELYKWRVKGRVFKFNNKKILLVYRSGYNKVELNGEELGNLRNKIEEKVGPIDYIINDYGENLLEKKSEIGKYV